MRLDTVHAVDAAKITAMERVFFMLGFFLSGFWLMSLDHLCVAPSIAINRKSCNLKIRLNLAWDRPCAGRFPVKSSGGQIERL